MLFIENEQIKLSFNTKGAELQSIIHKEYQQEYMWDGNPAFWAKHSPLLFPIVGTLKANTYFYEGASYQLSRHGFARDKEFTIESQGDDNITFLLTSDAETKKVYPFEFELRVIYRIVSDGFTTTYKVTNPDQKDLYFSVGGHPAFKLPLTPGTSYTDYFLDFDKPETISRWPISPDGLIKTTPEPLLDNTRRLPLTKDLFARDALVLKHPASSGIGVRSTATPRGFHMDFSGFPFLGIWAAPGADFVCLEPWCGIADSVDADQQWTSKEGINHLPAGQTFERTWTLTMY